MPRWKGGEDGQAEVEKNLGGDFLNAIQMKSFGAAKDQVRRRVKAWNQYQSPNSPKTFMMDWQIMDPAR